MQLPKEDNRVPKRLGPYVLGKRLGGGGMGDVYAGSHVLMSARSVAIKLLKSHLADQPQFVQRFLREIAALGGVKAHPNLVRAEFADHADNVPYLVMEYVEGIDLGRLLERRGPLPVGVACEIIGQAARGLAAIHEAGLVHRDLKPSNLMLTREGVVKILDLGLARLQMTDGPVDELTNSHCFLGTSDYTAPEQADDARSVDIRADIYSLGCTIYKLLTGHAPYAEFSTVVQKLRAHAETPFPGWPASVPPELEAILAKMVAKNRDERFDTPTELATALAPFGAGSNLTSPELAEALNRPEEARIETPANAVAETVSGKSAGEPAETLTFAPVPPPPVAKPRRLSRKFAAATVVGLLSILAIIAFAIAFRGGEVRDPYDVDKLEPMKWHPLFIREPAKLVWTKTDKAGHTAFDANMQQFFITNHDLAYFKVGTTQKRNYKFQVTLSRMPLERVGVFFGYRTPEDDPTIAADEFARFQYVSFILEGDKASPALERGRMKLQRKEQGGRITPLGFPLVSTELVDKEGQKVLEVSVTEQDLVRIYLDNVELSALAEIGPGYGIPDEDFRGAFGVFTNDNSCHFRDAKVYLFAPGN